MYPRLAVYAVRLAVLWLFVSFAGAGLFAQATQTAPSAQGAQTATKPYKPQVGQAGKDVVWVPTPQPLVDKMLDLAKVTPQDHLIDLGSGDGRTVITAAKRGLRAEGIEYNPEMVELARRNAAEAGVSDKATFVKADLFKTDLSKAQVITMFLLPSINMKLRPTLLEMKPGTRIVSNSFTMGDWPSDEDATVTEGCQSWCTAHLWIVPAKVAGTWQLGNEPLTLEQKFQAISGTLGSTAIADGRLRGDEITFTAGPVKYTGHVTGNGMRGTSTGGSNGSWTASRQQ